MFKSKREALMKPGEESKGASDKLLLAWVKLQCQVAMQHNATHSTFSLYFGQSTTITFTYSHTLIHEEAVGSNHRLSETETWWTSFVSIRRCFGIFYWGKFSRQKANLMRIWCHVHSQRGYSLAASAKMMFFFFNASSGFSTFRLPGIFLWRSCWLRSCWLPVWMCRARK